MQTPLEATGWHTGKLGVSVIQNWAISITLAPLGKLMGAMSHVQGVY